ncbi:hypothetical protein ACTQ49_05635 [Luteococcus sp. Sow4_B9]|uniref:hypothetical protein n=1 Tax=Luteococcus sp. Sow4_B9 TaxID=3438792 RepID=UPI003F99906F
MGKKCCAGTAACQVPSAVTSAAGLVGGYAVARFSGNRPLGGAVLAAAGVAAGMKWKEKGALTTAGLTALYLGAFGGSHPLAKKIGAWPSVFTVAGVTALASWALVDRH